MSVKFGLWSFHKLLKMQKNLTLLFLVALVITQALMVFNTSSVVVAIMLLNTNVSNWENKTSTAFPD